MRITEQDVHKAGSCMACDRGTFADHNGVGVVVYPYKQVVVINTGVQETRLCPDCAAEMVDNLAKWSTVRKALTRRTK
jgi:hypothetical protein